MPVGVDPHEEGGVPPLLRVPNALTSVLRIERLPLCGVVNAENSCSNPSTSTIGLCRMMSRVAHHT